MTEKKTKVDTNEFDLPETVYSRDIENQVFQGVVLHTLADIEGITLLEGNFFDNILGRDSLEGVKGIYAEQDSKNRAVSIKIVINVCYDISIPEKAEEIQEKVDAEVTRITGLHVNRIHVVFKNIVHTNKNQKLIYAEPEPIAKIEEEYNDQF